MNATSPRDETFAVEDGYLVRRAVPRCGKPYIHRCPLGASWEGFLLQQVVEHLGAAWEECFFWATHSGAELDLLWVRGRRRWGFEFKRTSSPRLTGSLRTAIGISCIRRIQDFSEAQAGLCSRRIACP